MSPIPLSPLKKLKCCRGLHVCIQKSHYITKQVFFKTYTYRPSLFLYVMLYLSTIFLARMSYKNDTVLLFFCLPLYHNHQIILLCFRSSFMRRFVILLVIFSVSYWKAKKAIPINFFHKFILW